MSDLEKFNMECLERVNELRRLFKVPPVKLRLSLIQRPPQVELYSGAQDWADNLAYNDVLQSDREAIRNEVGESICRLYSDKFCTFSGGAVINAWFDEAIEYSESSKKLLVPENFLQLIWSPTRYCGFGFAVSPKTSSMYTVARYKPMLSTVSDNLGFGVDQEAQRFDAAHGPGAFTSTAKANLSQDVSYVKRNLFCAIPEGLPANVEVLQTRAGRYRLSHLVKQTTTREANSRDSVVRGTGYVYINEQIERTNDVFIVMQNG